MNLLWRDNFESFLDASAPDASASSTPFANTVGPDPAFPSGQPLLWTGIDPGPSAGADLNTVSLGGFDAGTASLPSGLNGQDMLWAEPRSTATWQLADNAGDTGAPTFGIPSLPFSADMPSDVGSLVWQPTLFRDAALHQALDLVWPTTGGTGAPPLTLPNAPTNLFLDGFPGSFPASPLVWPGDPPTNLVPGAAGQPPLTAPAAGNAQPAYVLGYLAPENLVWTDPSLGVPATLNEQPNVGAVSLPTLFSRA